LLFLAWGGEEARCLDVPRELYQGEFSCSLQDIGQVGINHRGVADRNI
jgi:hypothetical protein